MKHGYKYKLLKEHQENKLSITLLAEVSYFWKQWLNIRPVWLMESAWLILYCQALCFKFMKYNVWSLSVPVFKDTIYSM